MRILQVIPDNKRGGGEVLAHQLQQHLLSQGYDSHLAFFCGKEVSTAHVHNLGGVSPRDPRCYFRLKRLVKELSPDIIHAHMLPAQVATKVLPTTALKVTTEHNTSHRRHKFRAGRELDRWCLGGFPKIAVISPGVRRVLAAMFPDLAQRLVLVQNGVDLTKYKANLTPPAQPHFVSVGRLEAQKNLPFAIAQLAPQLARVQAQYTIYGDGYQRAELAALIKQNGWNHIHLAGRSDTLPQLLPQYSAMLLPSLWEGFGLVAVEGMASGLPVLGSKVAGLEDIITPQSGLTFDPSSGPSMQAAVCMFMDMSSAQQAAMRDAATKRAQDFSILPMFASYIQLYHNLTPAKDYHDAYYK